VPPGAVTDGMEAGRRSTVPGTQTRTPAGALDGRPGAFHEAGMAVDDDDGNEMNCNRHDESVETGEDRLDMGLITLVDGDIGRLPKGPGMVLNSKALPASSFTLRMRLPAPPVGAVNTD